MHGQFPRQFPRLALTGRPYTPQRGHSTSNQKHWDIHTSVLSLTSHCHRRGAPPIAIHHPLLHGQFPRQFSRLALTGHPYTPQRGHSTTNQEHWDIHPNVLSLTSHCHRRGDPPIAIHHPLLHGQFPRQFTRLP
ncbi:MAG: hypothetical protein J0L96_04455 [Anaerolineae bacterium]|nr:hypothetical protein [Anaerolineae bacterium]